MILKLVGLAAIAVFVSCARSGPHQPTGAELGGGHGAVDYNQVRPVFARYCSACHPGRSNPNWLDYNEASVYVKNGILKKRLVTDKSMPPPGSPEAASISESDRQLVARWIAGGGPQALSKAAGAEEPHATPPRPNEAQSCLQCHGESGPGSTAQPKIPRLAGQNFSYLIRQLQLFKWRGRLDPTNQMNDVAADLNERDLEKVAEYFSGLKGLAMDGPPDLNARASELFEAGKKLATERCNSCHMNAATGGRPNADGLPILAGQSHQYLINQLLYFQNDERRSPLMHELTKGLSHRDIEALATYFCNVR